MPAVFPAYQHMSSHDADPTPHLESCMRTMRATADDIEIADLRESYKYEQPGIMCRYTLRWKTYAGWRTYMLMTGIIASDPRYETPES